MSGRYRPCTLSRRSTAFCYFANISLLAIRMFLKPAFVGSEYRFYGFRSELRAYCRPEPGFSPQLWRPFWNERQPQRLCLQMGWGRATVNLCMVISIRRTSFPEASSHFYEINVLFMDIKLRRWRNTEMHFIAV